MSSTTLIKKTLLFCITVLLIEVSTISCIDGSTVGDELDQHQTVRTDVIGGHKLRVAQSFKPTLNTLTRVELFAVKKGDPKGILQVSIRKSLYYLDELTSISIPAQDISPEGEWYEFDFPDIYVIPGETYFILWTPDNKSWDADNLLLWGCNQYDDLYPRGEIWREVSPGEWVIEDTSWDCCFKTYGYNRRNTPPDPPIITGPIRGTAGKQYEYTFCAIDPDGDDIYYAIEWGDGGFAVTFYPHPSGEEITLSHEWQEKGDYTIKAKAMDTLGAVSDWGYLNVSMPRNRITNLFLQFLMRFMNLSPLIRNAFSHLKTSQLLN